MRDKALEAITFSDVAAFVQERWPEGKTVDYKRDTYGGKDEDKRELLKDVSSFANTLGGDILIGVDEANGIPTDIPGVALLDVDKEKLRLEAIIRHGVEPRIEFGIHQVSTPSATSVLIVRMRESFLLPHRVVFQGKFGEFWARSSAGKYSMDTDELRRAFTLSDSIYDKIKSFRRDRVCQIASGETPVPLMMGGAFILHLIPVSAFRTRQLFDVVAIPQYQTAFSTIPGGGWDSRFNLDGIVTYGPSHHPEGCRCYTQFFRNGIVEAVLAGVVRADDNGGKVLFPTSYESALLQRHQAFNQLLAGLQKLGIQPPIWCCLTIAGGKGARIVLDYHFPDENKVIDRDIVAVPEAIIDSYGVDSTTILRPLFDMIWNASGHAGSANFDSNGKWCAR